MKRWLRHAPAVLGLALLVGAIIVVRHEFRNLRLKDIEEALSAIPTRALLVALVWTFLAYFVLTFYDRLGTIYAGNRVSYRRAAFASFCAYTLSHNLGFAAVSGAAVRYRLYAHWGLTPVQIAKTVAFCSLTFGLGGMVLGGSILFLEPQAVPFFGQRLPAIALYAVGVALWLIVLGYVTLAKIFKHTSLFGHDIELPGWRMAVLQVLLATLDVAVTATIFYSLIPASPHLTWLIFLGIYLTSYTAGLAANLPGGIGVFDTAMLLGLAPYMSAPHIVGAIFVFRLYYYIIPLFLAGALFTGNEILLRGSGVLRHLGRLSPVQAVGRWNEPDFAVTAAVGAVSLCGMLMLSLGVLFPKVDFSWLGPDNSGFVLQAGQFVSSLIGAGLVIMAVGLSHRVNLAWGLTLWLLVIGAAVTATQSSRLWVAGVLLLTVLLLAPFRSCFYRHPHVINDPLDPTSALTLCALGLSLFALAMTRPHIKALENNAFWAVVLSREVPNSVRLTVAISVLMSVGSIWFLLRPGRVRYLPWDSSALRTLFDLGVAHPIRADGVILGEASRAALPFRRCGSVLVGLGDPVGDPTDRVSAIWRLHDLARQEGVDAAAWGVGPNSLQVYGGLGFIAVPLDSGGLPLLDVAADRAALGNYLVYEHERDMRLLLPVLPGLVADAAGTVTAEG